MNQEEDVVFFPMIEERSPFLHAHRPPWRASKERPYLDTFPNDNLDCSPRVDEDGSLLGLAACFVSSLDLFL